MRCILFMVLVGCNGALGDRAMTGQCPEISCSPETPGGLAFYGEAISEHSLIDGLFGTPGPSPTAVGGSQQIAIGGLDGLPYDAIADGTEGITVTGIQDDTVSIRGFAQGSNYLRIVDPETSELYDRKLFDGATITDLSLAPVEFEAGPRHEWAFLPGTVHVAIALWGDALIGDETLETRVVDSSMTVVTPPTSTAIAWDAFTFPAAVGSYSVQVAAGDQSPAQLTFAVVDHIDSIQTYELPTHFDSSIGSACFLGVSGASNVAGLDWHFLVNGIETDAFSARNCVPFVVPMVATTIELVARAGGLSATFHLPVVLSGASIAPSRPRPTSDGERAAMRTPAGLERL
jgi:hypothetical protein